jgi:hypothetical protein
LKLHQEALEDAAKKKAELAHTLDVKRMELLNLKRAQLEARRITDPQLEQQIAEMGERLARYVPPTPAKPEPPKGLIQLKKKRDDGNLVAVAT